MDREHGLDTIHLDLRQKSNVRFGEGGMLMLAITISFLVGLMFSIPLTRAAARGAFDSPPTNPLAHRSGRAAFSFFMAFAVLFVAASLTHTLAGGGLLRDVLGFSGLACLLVCAVCLLGYVRVNKGKRCDELAEL